MTEKLDSETRLLAAMAYGESSTADVFEEMAALANVMVRQSRARGYSTIAAFTAKEASFSYVVADGNKRYAKLMTAKDEEIENSPSMSDAVKAAKNALNGGEDYSNGAYFWDGADIRSNYKNHFKVAKGIRFTDPSHNIYGIKESTKLVKKIKTTKIKVNGKIETRKEELWRYDHIYQSTAAYGGTIFWKQNPDYIRYTHAKEYL
ncbi:hypothetical protein CMPELA_00115 [Cupriavidus necator]|uniref:Uncharacterized protein n=1 Tax=Cupriavidus necator (strain ATCC 17699 / DSM 428 / KCTC 22496 / NCIMB 10442 / H16 / Stanier 337) TaxID=381666 RepID=Q0KFP7_CUPNH|nr:hypothetical protein [Cupriavidus necator]QCB99145.1 hypothetical protein E6A55_00120 [Cupriavidus necator H16]QQB78039.1 hypothetical protein I6H87_06940 [Cupriavidus necator]WKA40968.1 hypothetical protein QWP09_00110 [Cupriavidus necator]CAJ91174.1 conserved hypothetical protein [Cupriavidus necator H16]